MVHNLIFFIEDVINSIVSTVTGDKNVHSCEKRFVSRPEIGPKHFDKLKPGPTYNSAPLHIVCLTSEVLKVIAFLRMFRCNIYQE